jgi:hypothetical protein
MEWVCLCIRYRNIYILHAISVYRSYLWIGVAERRPMGHAPGATLRKRAGAWCHCSDCSGVLHMLQSQRQFPFMPLSSCCNTHPGITT